MADESSKSPSPTLRDTTAEPGEAGGAVEEERGPERSDRSITDFVRRAVSAGVGAAAKSKEDIMRAAGSEVRAWLEHLNLNEEIAKVLAKMVIEVKTEIRFRPSESGKLVPETTNDVKLKGPR